MDASTASFVAALVCRTISASLAVSMPALCNWAKAAPASTEPSCFTSPTRMMRASCLSARSNSRAVSRADNSEASSTIHAAGRSEEHTSELQSLMRISYAVFCLKKKKEQKTTESKKDKSVPHSKINIKNNKK